MGMARVKRTDPIESRQYPPTHGNPAKHEGTSVITPYKELLTKASPQLPRSAPLDTKKLAPINVAK